MRQPERVSTDRDLGPRVPTILVNAGKKLCENTSKVISDASETKSIHAIDQIDEERESAYRFGWLED